jgi:hypothetical protein
MSENEMVKAPGGTGVTFIACRTVFPGHEHEFGQWGERIVELSGKAPGSLGVTILAPESGGPGTRYIIHRFVDETSLNLWQSNKEVKELVSQADKFSTRRYEKATGLETWFAVPGLGAVAAPPNWKMFLVTTLGAYLVFAALNIILLPYVGGWPLLASLLLIIILGVGILTWFVMPGLSSVFRDWLYPEEKQVFTRHG